MFKWALFQESFLPGLKQHKGGEWYSAELSCSCWFLVLLFCWNTQAHVESIHGTNYSPLSVDVCALLCGICGQQVRGWDLRNGAVSLTGQSGSLYKPWKANCWAAEQLVLELFFFFFLPTPCSTERLYLWADVIVYSFCVRPEKLRWSPVAGHGREEIGPQETGGGLRAWCRTSAQAQNASFAWWHSQTVGTFSAGEVWSRWRLRYHV